MIDKNCLVCILFYTIAVSHLVCGPLCDAFNTEMPKSHNKTMPGIAALHPLAK